MDPEIAKFIIDDLAAATYVPYNEDGSVNYDGVAAHAKDLIDHAVPYAFINGTTGDSMILSVPERKGLAEAWMAANKACGIKIINHIGANSITEVKEMAAHSEAIGCHAIAAMPPMFFKCASTKDLALWLKEIGAAAPKTPLYFYHFNAITGVFVDPDALITAIEEVGIPSFRGFKFTDFNLWHYSNCVNHGGYLKYDVCYGRDEAMLGGLAIGARSSIGNGFNFAPGVYHRIRRAFFAGDMAEARKQQCLANTTVNILNDAAFGGNGLAVSRLMYEWKSKGVVKLGPPRAPIKPLTEEQKVALKARLEEVGYFTWCD